MRSRRYSQEEISSLIECFHFISGGQYLHNFIKAGLVIPPIDAVNDIIYKTVFVSTDDTDGGKTVHKKGIVDKDVIVISDYHLYRGYQHIIDVIVHEAIHVYLDHEGGPDNEQIDDDEAELLRAKWMMDAPSSPQQIKEQAIKHYTTHKTDDVRWDEYGLKR